MTWILIVMWFGYGSMEQGRTSIAVEFHSKEACQAAASALRKQSEGRSSQLGAMVCAAKGDKK